MFANSSAKNQQNMFLADFTNCICVVIVCCLHNLVHLGPPLRLLLLNDKVDVH